jgi:hypothetical protein
MKSHKVVAKAGLRGRLAAATIDLGWRVDSFPTQGGDAGVFAHVADPSNLGNTASAGRASGGIPAR